MRATAKQLSVIDYMRMRLEQERQKQAELAGVVYEEGERAFKYDSLNEHLVTLSLTRAAKRKEWKLFARLSIGWVLNHAFFVMLLLTFTVYGCVFEETSTVDHSDELLMYSWAWSIMQRFVVNEPFIIILGVLIPMLFATEFCANMCTESCNNVLGVAVAMCITFLKRMRRA